MATLVLSMSCSTWVKSDWGDCGYSAFYEVKGNGENSELVFSQVTAETVGGHRNCGFQYIRSKVDRAEIEGAALPERAETDKFERNTYYYAAPAGFDAGKTPITIHVGGNRYRSDLASVDRIDKNVYVKLRLE